MDQAFDELELLSFPLCSPFWLTSSAEQAPSSAERCASFARRPRKEEETLVGPAKLRKARPTSEAWRTSTANSWDLHGTRAPARVLGHPLEGTPENGKITLRAYFVCDKVVPTVKGKRMSFGCWVDEQGRYFDSVHFPDVYARYPFRGPGVYELQGVVAREFDFPSLETRRMERLPYSEDLRFTD